MRPSPPTNLVLLAFLICCQPLANAALILSESFDYSPVGDPLPTPYSDSGSTGIGQIGDNLTFPGITSTGNSGTSSDRFTSSERALGQSFNTAGTNTTETFYMSYLLNVSGISTWGGNAMIGISLGSAGNNDGFYTGVVGNTADGDNNKDWGVVVGRPNTGFGASNRDDISANVSAGNDVYYVLAKFEVDTSGDYNTVPGGLRASMSIYSAAEGLPASEPVTWDATVTADRGFPWTGPTTTLDTLTLYRDNSPVEAVFDEVLIGTSFADVVTIPEPAAGLLFFLGLTPIAFRRRYSNPN